MCDMGSFYKTTFSKLSCDDALYSSPECDDKDLSDTRRRTLSPVNGLSVSVIKPLASEGASLCRGVDGAWGVRRLDTHAQK